MPRNYTLKQRKTLAEVRRIARKLINIEELEKRKYRPQLGLEGYMDASAADLELDNQPSYSVLEENLREAITQAKDIGLNNDPLVKKVGELAFEGISK